MIVAAIKHPGFSFMDVFQPCVTFNKFDTYTSYYDSVYALGKEHRTNDRAAALAKALETDKQPVGIFYQDTNRPPYLAELPYMKHSLIRSSLSNRNMKQLMQEFI
jgi:2-oxoglutarate ferredoxin oxidoreductase subunit beta